MSGLLVINMLCGGELNPRDNGRELSQRDEKEEGGGGKGEEEEATIDSLAESAHALGNWPIFVSK